ncbi:MAG: penicillin-binding protein 2 [Syntrophobacterales bacterium]|nr:penicillin-binding protein 2 [Syntrophobacterales bacterium]
MKIRGFTVKNGDPFVKVNVYFVMFFFIGVIFAYALRLYYLQVIKGEFFQNQAENNRIRTETTSAPRGIIRDARGVILVDNRPAYHVYLVREKIPVGEVINKISKFCDVPEESLKGILEKNKRTPLFKPIRLMVDINWDCLAKIEANGYRLPGVYVEVEPVRSYRFPGLASHVLGHLGEITEEELLKPEYSDYTGGDDIGRTGIEKAYEKVLRGERGLREVEVDALGRKLRVLEEKDPTAGHGLWLTIDAQLQYKATELMKDLEGVMVVLDVKTGAVRALVSTPSFDENLFVKGIKAEDWKKLNTDPKHPLLNRAIQSAYPPGSTIKPFLALAGLQEGIIGKGDKVNCPGFFRFGNRDYRCWKKGGHGSVDLWRAITESCDVYFYQLGNRLGITKLSAYFKMFGFGSPTGIELPGEKSGIVPSPEWKLRFLRQPWHKGETISVAIGQGYLSVTPLQLAAAYVAIANEGMWLKPYLVEQIEGEEKKGISSRERRHLPIKAEYFKVVKNGLEGVVRDQRGTAHRIWNESIPIAGKTGTAQVVKLIERVENEAKIPKQFRDHAWFAGYAPTNDPEIVVVAIVEHGGHGGSAAAPIVGAVIEEYFQIFKSRGATQ